MRSKFLYSESGLSEATGISRTQLSSFRKRKMAKGGQWRQGKGKGRPIEYSEIGVELVLEEFGIKDADISSARIDFGKSAKPAGDAMQDMLNNALRAPVEPLSVDTMLTVLPDLRLVHVSQLVPNNRILRAKNGTGEIYQVIVPSSLVWSVGDPMRIKPSQMHKGYWQLEGKAPRWRGDRIYRHGFV